MTDLNSQIAAAKSEIATLKGDIAKQLQKKKDKTLADVATESGSVQTTIRTPPSQVKIRRTLKGHFGKVTAIQWGGDSNLLVSASQDGNILVWNAATNHKIQVLQLKSSYVMSLGIEQTSNNLIACGGLDNLCTIYRRDDPSGKPVTEMASHDGFLSCCRFLNDNQVLSSSGDSTIIQWDISRSQPVNTFAEHTADAMYVAIQPQSKNIFVSCSVDTTCKIWDTRIPKSAIQTFSGFHTGDINAVDFMPSDPNIFATSSQDGTVRLFDIRSYNELNSFGGGSTAAAAAAASGATPAAEGGSVDGYTSVAGSKSGRLVFAGHTNGTIHAFDTLSTKDTPVFIINNAHDRNVSNIGVSPAGDALATAGWDGIIKVWA